MEAWAGEAESFGAVRGRGHMSANRRFLVPLRQERAGMLHGVGFLGKNYLIQATEDIAEVFRKTGIACRVTEV